MLISAQKNFRITLTQHSEKDASGCVLVSRLAEQRAPWGEGGAITRIRDPGGRPREGGHFRPVALDSQPLPAAANWRELPPSSEPTMESKRILHEVQSSGCLPHNLGRV